MSDLRDGSTVPQYWLFRSVFVRHYHVEAQAHMPVLTLLLIQQTECTGIAKVARQHVHTGRP